MTQSNMSEIRLTLMRPEVRIVLEQRELRFSLPRSVPGVGIPTGGDVGDVLTKTGVGDYVTGWEAPGTSANLTTYPAGENLSAGKIVIIEGGEAIYFQPANATHAGRVYGITKTSATVGNNVTIQIAGAVSDPSFAFVAESGLYAAANGAITETKPINPIIQHVGFAVDAGTMKIEFWPTIQ